MKPPPTARRWRIGTIVALMLIGLPRAQAQDLPPDFDETFAVPPMFTVLDDLAETSAIVRLDWQRFDVKHPGKATHRVRRVVTVLNESGREEGVAVIRYDDRLYRLKKLGGRLRDANGKVIRKLKKDDQQDFSAISGYSLYEDNRVRVVQLYHNDYPYTVEIDYELEHNAMVSWPTWYPQSGGLPVEWTQFEIEVPADMAVRYQARNLDLEPDVMQGGKCTQYVWHLTELPAYEREPQGPAWREQAMAVHVAPDVFEVEGMRGDMRTWASFGQWYHTLEQGRDVLPPEAVAEVRRLVEHVEDDREKMRILYRYLQEKTRYVSVQLGLGGWQPFEATYVHERGYGDCKALTNYMKALLKAAGVTAHPALIRSGEGDNEVVGQFTSNQFNHVILYVPSDEEPVWLECTSQTMPFGHVGAANEDRFALVVTPDGGELMRTPKSRADDNQQVRHAEVVLDEGGSAVADVTTRYTGNQQDRIRRALAQATGRNREDWLRRELDLPSFKILAVDFSGAEARLPEITLPVRLQLPRYAARTGTRLFLQPNLMERWASIPPATEDRTQPVIYPYAFSDVDSIRYVVPDGYTVEAMPDPVRAETDFGRYEAVLAADETSLMYTRRLEITATSIPADQYEAYRDFMRQVAQADRAQVVLVKAPPRPHANADEAADN